MAVMENLTGFYVKQRPKKYDDPDNVFGKVGGNSGWVIARKPKDYPLNSQQRKVKEAAEACGIESGISRKELKSKMKNCIPDQF